MANCPDALLGSVVAIGNFDGVHRGHQSVLEAALEIARSLGRPALVLTFEPHPRSFFRPDEPLCRITPAPMRARILSLLGFDGVVEQAFNAEFSALEAETFVREVLVGALGVVHAVIGFDFHFGRARGGSPAFLRDAGQRYGFGVTELPAFTDEGGSAVSSSLVRASLLAGDPAGAAALLGYRYTVTAPVVHGAQLGRTLGYPTANMEMPADIPLRHGIYAVRLRRGDGSLHDGVASFGRRPTVTENGSPLLETYVFDFAGDLYSEVCSVSFFGWLRGEEKFDGLDALVARMRQDEAEARALLSGVTPLSSLDARISF